MKNMQTSVKLIVSFGIVLIMAVIVGMVGIIGMNSINNADDELYSYNVIAISQMAEIRDQLQRQRGFLRDSALLAGDGAELQRLTQSIADSDKLVHDYMATYESTITDHDAEADYFNAKSVYENEFADIKQQILEASKISVAAATEVLYMPEWAAYIEAMVNGFTVSMNNNNQWAKDQVNANTSLFTRMLIIEIVVLALAIAAVIILIIYISSLISTPLKALTAFMIKAGSTGDIELTKVDEDAIGAFSQAKDEVGQCIGSTAAFITRLHDISKALQSVADGDLTVDLTMLSERDTMGMALNKMMDNLNMMFGEINSATAQVSIGSKQIADGSQSLAQGSTEQAAAVQELSSSIAEIADKTKANAEMAEKAATLANTIKGNAEKGSRQMDEMMTAVKEINDASQSINKVIKVIDDIAFQTNILALNAAVEAARAGQHGKGFAVVAEEVRNLAAKSAEAAKDTESLIANSMEKAELGARIAEETSTSLTDIVSGINESTQLVSDIAKSSEEQALGISQVNTGIDQVAQVVQQNSATAEQSAAASQEMSGQSDTLQGLVAQFKLKNKQNNARLSSPQRLSAPTGGNGSYGKY